MYFTCLFVIIRVEVLVLLLFEVLPVFVESKRASQNEQGDYNDYDRDDQTR